MNGHVEPGPQQQVPEPVVVPPPPVQGPVREQAGPHPPDDPLIFFANGGWAFVGFETRDLRQYANVSHDAQGKVYTVRYEAVNAMLLNEFLKEHRRVQELEKGIENLTAIQKKQELLLQNVNARLEGVASSALLNAPTIPKN